MKHIPKSYRLLTFALAILIFTLSSGIVIDMHYCGGKLKTVGVFTKAKKCKGEIKSQKMMACSKKTLKNDIQQSTINKKQCCQSKTLILQNNNTQSQHKIITTSSNLLVLYIKSELLTQKLNYLNEELSSFNIYKPPLFTKDIQILYHSFLI